MAKSIGNPEQSPEDLKMHEYCRAPRWSSRRNCVRLVPTTCSERCPDRFPDAFVGCPAHPFVTNGLGRRTLARRSADDDVPAHSAPGGRLSKPKRCGEQRLKLRSVQFGRGCARPGATSQKPTSHWGAPGYSSAAQWQKLDPELQPIN